MLVTDVGDSFWKLSPSSSHPHHCDPINKFCLGWLKNSVIEIGTAASYAFIFIHLNWKPSQWYWRLKSIKEVSQSVRYSGCVFPMVAVSILPRVEFGLNDYFEDTVRFNRKFFSKFWKKDILYFLNTLFCCNVILRDECIALFSESIYCFGLCINWFNSA